jgi:hypothetical protein
MKKIASFTCNEDSTGDYTSNFSNMKLFVFFLYIGFCIASFAIPDSVAFGESLCFAYSYAMVQVLEVALFTGNAKFLVIGIVFASVLPTLQILQGLQNSYTTLIDNIYAELYMSKEIILYMLQRNRHSNGAIDRQGHDSIVTLFVYIWILMDLIFWTLETNAAYKTFLQKSIYIARFSPVYWMAVINV